MPNQKVADIDFKLEWKSSVAKHTDVFRLYQVDPHNEKLPPNFAEKIADLKEGQSCSHTFAAKDILNEEYSTDKVINFKRELFDTQFKGQSSPPVLYRFYPSAIAWQGLNTDAKDYTPFRLNSANDETLIADQNHPLAKYYLTLTAVKIKEYGLPTNTDKYKREIGRLISSRGPGMQAPFEFGEPVFFKKYPFQRSDDASSTKAQLDSVAVNEINKLYSTLLSKHSKILDVQADEFSYLAEDYQSGLVVGIGANEKGLSDNPRLDTYQVQNLNDDVILPFETNSFDDAICSLSIETLCNPIGLIKEVARVVITGGKFIIVFSDNNPATQTITLWSQLHPFERIQLVLEYLRQTDLFEDINTFSKRGNLRSSNDKHGNKKPMSDPIYAVWGTIKG